MKRIFTLLFSVSCICAIAQTNAKTAAVFLPGDLVIYRVGDGAAALAATATPVFLDEYTIAGVPVQSIPLPTTVSGANRIVTSSGTATSEGLLTRSTDGLYVLATGYDAAVGTASITGSTSATINRTVARVDNAGTVNSSTALTDFSSGSNPRGVASTNGTDLWLTGGAGGVRYTTFGSTTSTQLSTDVTNIRAVHIFNGQLYISSASGTIRVATVGTGLPTTAGQSITNLPGFPTTTSPYQFFFADINPGVAGVDVLYVADDAGTTGIQKFSNVGGTWVANGTITGTPTGTRGLTGVVVGTTVTLYTTTSTALYQLVDLSGYNTATTGTTTTVTPLATAPTNTNFRGIALAPTAVSILPISLASFNASSNGKNSQLKWTTTNESNLKGFSVEKSLDGTTYTEFAFVAANNNANQNNYSIEDNNVNSGANYYRIKMVSNDGSYKYSQVFVINNKLSLQVEVFPNPAVNTLTITHSKADAGSVIRLLSIEGKQIKTYAASVGSVQSAISVSELTKGNYLLIFEGKGEKTTTKFTKL